jgi:hypothetical protein
LAPATGLPYGLMSAAPASRPIGQGLIWPAGWWVMGVMPM